MTQSVTSTESYENRPIQGVQKPVHFRRQVSLTTPASTSLPIRICVPSLRNGDGSRQALVLQSCASSPATINTDLRSAPAWSTPSVTTTAPNLTIWPGSLPRGAFCPSHRGGWWHWQRDNVMVAAVQHRRWRAVYDAMPLASGRSFSLGLSAAAEQVSDHGAEQTNYRGQHFLALFDLRPGRRRW
jgi:hypothetical protein